MGLAAGNTYTPHYHTYNIGDDPKTPLLHESQSHQGLSDNTEHRSGGILERLRIPEMPENETYSQYGYSTTERQPCPLSPRETPCLDLDAVTT
jgi:hypothetical protein